MPHRPAPEGAQSTRDQLLDAAITIAGGEGLARVTLRAVAAQVGVAHGLVRYHFGSREVLLSEAVARAAAQDAVEGHLDSCELDRFADGLVRSVLDHPERTLLQFDATVAAARGKGDVGAVRRDYDRYQAFTSATLARSGISDPDGARAALVFACLDGLLLQYLVYRDSARAEQALVALRAVLGLLAVDDT